MIKIRNLIAILLSLIVIDIQGQSIDITSGPFYSDIAIPNNWGQVWWDLSFNITQSPIVVVLSFNNGSAPLDKVLLERVHQNGKTLVAEVPGSSSSIYSTTSSDSYNLVLGGGVTQLCKTATITISIFDGNAPSNLIVSRTFIANTNIPSNLFISSSNPVTDESVFHMQDEFLASNSINISSAFNYEAGIYDDASFKIVSGCAGMRMAPAIQNGSGMSEVSDEWSVNIYPNPSNGVFKLETSKGDARSLSVFNIQGQFLFSQEIGKDISETEINLSDNPNGVYLVEIRSGDQVSRTRLVKQ